MMQFLKVLFIGILITLQFAWSNPAFADRPDYKDNPDYQKVTQTLNQLSKMKTAAPEGTNLDEIQGKIDALAFQKYALETGNSWGQCRNETGKNIAVYGIDPDADDDDLKSVYDNDLYFLGTAQTTEEDWNCQGIYVPASAKVTGLNSGNSGTEIVGPVAIKIPAGTQLVVKTNPETGAFELNVPDAEVLKAGQANWFIPNVAQSLIDSRASNAPVEDS